MDTRLPVQEGIGDGDRHRDGDVHRPGRVDGADVARRGGRSRTSCVGSTSSCCVSASARARRAGGQEPRRRPDGRVRRRGRRGGSGGGDAAGARGGGTAGPMSRWRSGWGWPPATPRWRTATTSASRWCEAARLCARSPAAARSCAPTWCGCWPGSRQRRGVRAGRGAGAEGPGRAGSDLAGAVGAAGRARRRGGRRCRLAWRSRCRRTSSAATAEYERLTAAWKAVAGRASGG